VESKHQPQVTALKAHLAINVSNVVASIEFYRKLFGIEPSKVRHGYAKFDVQNPPLNFTLNEGQVSSGGALSHLGIQVATSADVFAVREQWTAAGLISRSELQTNCCYALQDKAWVRDPDGNEWEVFVVLEDNLGETAPCECGVTAAETAAATTEATAGCCSPVPVGITHELQVTEASCC
jgi:catechol 2,3-dioxygenase-like lactoylglutathione lyase family enzyme